MTGTVQLIQQLLRGRTPLPKGAANSELLRVLSELDRVPEKTVEDIGKKLHDLMKVALHRMKKAQNKYGVVLEGKFKVAYIRGDGEPIPCNCRSCQNRKESKMSNITMITTVPNLLLRIINLRTDKEITFTYIDTHRLMDGQGNPAFVQRLREIFEY